MRVADEELYFEAAQAGVPISIGDAACTIDSAGHVVGWNAAAERLFGVRRHEALGRTCHQVVRCHDLRSQARCAERCPAVESLCTGLPAPASPILVHDRAGRALGVTESVLLVSTGAERRALLSFVPIPSGVVDPAPSAGGALAGASGTVRDAPPDIEAQLDRLLAATKADAAEMFITAPVGRQLLLASHRGLAARAFREITSFEPGSGFPGLVAQTGQPLLSFDLRLDDRYLRTQVKRRGFRSYLCVPVSNEAGFFGSLHIAWLDRDCDLTSRLPLLAGVAHGLATALEVTRFRVAQPIASYLPFELSADADVWRASDLVLRTLREHTAAAGALLLLVSESPALEPVVERGLSSPPEPQGLRRFHGLSGSPAERGDLRLSMSRDGIDRRRRAAPRPRGNPVPPPGGRWEVARRRSHGLGTFGSPAGAPSRLPPQCAPQQRPSALQRSDSVRAGSDGGPTTGSAASNRQPRLRSDPRPG